jgi:RsiW-degrading membrane proteinase PrsW (M82 family)
MNTEYLLLFTIIFSALFFVIQRTEAKRRLFVTVLLAIMPGIFLRNWVIYRDMEREGWTALIIALVLNFLFWALIGRYNPVGSSDKIQVLGLDD